MRVVSILAVLCAALTASAQTISNPHVLRGWAQAATEGRADIVMLGDSNQAYQAHGWDAGWTRATRATVGTYGTGLIWCGENNGGGLGFGDGYGNVNNGSSGFAFTGAPIDAANVANGHATYLYLATGTLTGARQMGLWTTPAAVNSASTLRWIVTDGTFSGGGSYHPVVRLGQAPWSVLGDWGTVSTSGSLGLRTTAYTLPANPSRTGPLEFRFAPYAFMPDISGPFLAVRSRVEDTAITTGSVVHSYYGVGGRSSRWMAGCVQATSDAAIAAYFADVRQTCSHVLVCINQGLNDRVETTASINGITPGNSPAAYVDNMTYVIDRVQAVWAANNWPLSELHVLVTVAHPIATPQDSVLTSYVEAMRALSRDDIAVTAVAELFTESDFLANNWYANSTDRYHLSPNGYDAVSLAQLNAVLSTACVADFNQSGVVDGDDVIAFFAHWDDGDAAADMNTDGGVDGDDVGFFFVHWDAGC